MGSPRSLIVAMIRVRGSQHGPAHGHARIHLDRTRPFTDCCLVDLPPAVDDAASQGSPAPSILNVVRGPASVFVVLAAITAAVGAISLPIALLPEDMWASRPLTLANNVASVLLGAVVFGRRPDIWATNRPLAAAAVLIAVGALIETLWSVAVLVAWQAAWGQSSLVGWTLIGVNYVGGALHVLGVALIWLALRRSLPPNGGQVSRRLAAVLWGVALLAAVGRLASTVEIVERSGPSIGSVTIAIGLVISLGSLVTVTGLTVIAITGARMRGRPTAAWWLAAASGVAAIFGPVLAPVLGAITDEQVLFWMVPQIAQLVSTLLLLAAFAVGLPWSRGNAPRRAGSDV